MQRRSFMKLMATSAAGVGAAGVVSGCKLKGSSSNIRPYVRMVSVATGQKFTTTIYNGSTTGSVLNNSMTLDTTSTGTPNGAFSEYQQIDWEGTYVISLLPYGSTNANAAYGTATLSPAQGSHYTCYVYPASGSTTSTTTLGTYLVNDDPQTVNSGQYIIRMLNTMAPATYNMYLTPTGTSTTPLGNGSDLTAAQLIWSASGVGITNYTAGASSGTFRLRLTDKAGNVVFDTDQISLANGGAYTVVTYSLGSSTLPTVMLVTPSGDPVILTNNLTRIRAVQGSSDLTGVAPAPTSNILINGITKASATFGSPTSYFIVPAGKVTVQFQASTASTSNTYLTVSQTFVGGQDYAVYSTSPSTSANPTSLVLIDNNLPLSNGADCGMTFVNATTPGDAQSSSISITIESAYLLDPTTGATLAIASGTATATNAETVGDHKISFLNANNHGTILINNFDSNTPTAVVAGGLYTYALVGNSTGTFAVAQMQTNAFN
ncbi:MAG: DUF4397 domain-containing protein [Burkholderiales bacterium]|nr:DUF4397 domain-containing protein [Burkholderiales bacterium]